MLLFKFTHNGWRYGYVCLPNRFGLQTNFQRHINYTACYGGLFNLIFMNTLEIWSKDINFETRRIKDWNINQIPREGEYIQIDMKARKVEQVIYDLDNFKIVCVVV